MGLYSESPQTTVRYRQSQVAQFEALIQGRREELDEPRPPLGTGARRPVRLPRSRSPARCAFALAWHTDSGCQHAPPRG